MLRKVIGFHCKNLGSFWFLLSHFFNVFDRNGDFRFIFKKTFMPHQTAVNITSSSMNGSKLSMKLFEECKNKIVLEFGSGGSTLLLASTARKIVSIESDKKFSNFMNNEIKRRNLQGKAMVLYANIGPTKSYGQPIEFLKSLYRFKYKNYIESFFVHTAGEFEPQVVFIDGRFRVWCAIECCKRIRQNFTLIVDDYFDRTEYHIIEKLIGPASPFVGNTAIFQINKNQFALAALNIDEKYKSDFR